MTRLERYRRHSPYAHLMAEAAKRYRAGETIRDIARWSGASYGAARTMLVNAGVKLRPVGRQSVSP